MMKRHTLLLSVVLTGITLISCKKFLDLKPDQSLYVPSTLTDCQALLDDYSKMNSLYPGIGEGASDSHYFTDATWNAITSKEERDNYIWATDGLHITSMWQGPYSIIFNSNMVLQVLEKIKPEDQTEYNRIKGSALFYRGYALFSIASLFCKPYDPSASTTNPGVPVRLSPDVDLIYGRGTVKETYQQIVQDLKSAVDLLPETSIIKSRPNKIAAYAALSRIYLAMRDYTNAGNYANLCLQKYNTLMNYYSLNSAATVPFQQFNAEVIFASVLARPTSLSQTSAKIVKTNLYDLYEANDIRKTIFFRTNTGTSAGTFAFKGSYEGSTSNLFCGLATDEIYLIRAECNARAGKTTEALKDLNDLLKTRWQVEKDANGNIIKDINGNPISKYVDYTANTADEALDIILKERRKELVFRGIRWIDLRRLNKEDKFAITLTRTVNSIVYSLPPNDNRYTLLIPQDVINNTGIPQNER